ncbi:tetratricopeptide repeat protein [Myxococcota bacterium]|nr:tetratricopeptide repeat protein [Myxococcota bacterium]
MKYKLISVIVVSILWAGCSVTTTKGKRLSTQAVARGGRELRRGELELAHAQFSLALEYQRTNPRAWNGLGILAMARQDHVKAEAYFRQALLLDERFVEAYGNLGALALSRSDPSAAVKWLKRALVLHPGLGTARFNLGLAYLALARTRLARQEFAKLFAQSPREPRFRLHYAYVLALSGAPLKALSHVAAPGVEARFPALSALVAGVSYNALGQYKKGNEALQRALRFTPGHREARLHIALANAAQGNLEKALTQLRMMIGEAVSHNEMGGVKLAYARLLIAHGERKRGAKILQKLKRTHRGMLIP